jgi:hypothetical protein
MASWKRARNASGAGYGQCLLERLRFALTAEQPLTAIGVFWFRTTPFWAMNRVGIVSLIRTLRWTVTLRLSIGLTKFL